MSNIPNPPNTILEKTHWETAYKLASLGRLFRPDPQFVADRIYPLVLAGCSNTGLHPEQFGDAILHQSKRMKRPKGKRQRKVGYLLGAASTVSFRDFCQAVIADGGTAADALESMAIMASVNREIQEA